VVRYRCSWLYCGCEIKAVFDIAPGGPDRVFDTDDPDAVVQINRKYSVLFSNRPFQRPIIRAYITPDNEICHNTEPTMVLDAYPMDEGETYPLAIDGHLFTVTRNGDKADFKYFTLQLANTV
jgi:hypothetical protein